MPRGHGLLFGFALVFLHSVEQGCEFLDFAAEQHHPRFAVAQSAFQFLQRAEDLPQFTLHGKRALGALLATGNRHVVETLARLREEKRIGIFQG